MPRQFFEDYCRELFDALDQGFCTIEVLFDETGRANDYRFTDVNAAFEQQTGLRNAVGKRIRELTPFLEDFWFQIYGDVARTGSLSGSSTKRCRSTAGTTSTRSA
jgi:PAS domain-containing protein